MNGWQLSKPGKWARVSIPADTDSELIGAGDLGQKEAKLEKKDAELERLSEEQLRHMEGGNAAKSVRQQKTKEESK